MESKISDETTMLVISMGDVIKTGAYLDFAADHSAECSNWESRNLDLKSPICLTQRSKRLRSKSPRCQR